MKKLKYEGVPVELSCQLLEVSRSGFYVWDERPPSKRAIENCKLEIKIIEVHQLSRKTYGAPRIYKHLKNTGYPSSRMKISRIMKKVGISGLIQRRFKVRIEESLTA